MAIYVLGDPHLSISGEKPMDVFGKNWKNHAAKIENAWRAAVRASDTVVLAGNLSWAISYEEARRDFSFLHQLPGEKILLKGNHDYWWSTAAKNRRFSEQNGWTDFTFLQNNCIVRDGAALCGTRGWDLSLKGEEDQKILRRELQRLELSLKEAPEGDPIYVFFHFPPFSENECPFMPLLKQHGVRACFYGHLHGVRQTTRMLSGIPFTLISADALDFKPLRISPAAEEDPRIFAKKGGFWRKLLSCFRSKC